MYTKFNNYEMYYSSALVASKACKILPRSAEGFTRPKASYVLENAKRSPQLVEIQELLKDIEKKN